MFRSSTNSIGGWSQQLILYYYFIQKGWDLKSLKPTILMLEQYIVFHLKTEEGVLIENGIPENTLTAIQDYRADFLTTLNEVTESAINHHEPEELASFLPNGG